MSMLAERGATVDVLLTDVVMPEMGGLELAVKAAERLPELPVILMSGYAHNDVDAIGADVLIAGFVTKPFTTESLLKAIREVVPSE